MKAIIWETVVIDSVMGMMHGQYFSIREIELPSEELTFNDYGGKFNVFKTENRHKKSNKLAEIELPDQLVDSIRIQYQNSFYLKDKTIEILKPFRNLSVRNS